MHVRGISGKSKGPYNDDASRVHVGELCSSNNRLLLVRLLFCRMAQLGHPGRRPLHLPPCVPKIGVMLRVGHHILTVYCVPNAVLIWEVASTILRPPNDPAPIGRVIGIVARKSP